MEIDFSSMNPLKRILFALVFFPAFFGLIYFYFWFKSPSLPSCNYYKIKNKIENAVRKTGVESSLNMHEISFDKLLGTRLCSATIKTKDFGTTDLKYSISWTDKTTFFSVFKREREYSFKFSE